MNYFLMLLSGCIALACFSGNPPEPAVPQPADTAPDSLLPYIDPSGKTIETRFPAPAGFIRLPADSTSFAAYLRRLPVHPHGYPVHLYDGTLKGRQDVHIAVLDIDVGRRDLQQCADAIIRLRAEYLYQQKRYADIRFHFTNGFVAEYARWRRGERIRVEGNRAWWTFSRQRSDTYAAFRQYLDVVFAYAGTASLERELAAADPATVQPGYLWIQGGHPGHAVIVVDVAINPENGERLFLLAQSYMPAQEMHVLKNPANSDGCPWYSAAKLGETLETPEWTFLKSKCKM